MEKFKHVKPTKKYEQKAIDYINEFYKYNSEINGVGGLHRYLNNYDEWLLKLEEDRKRIPDEEKVPAKTFFLVRESDDKIVGMINIRLALNERLKKFGGHIGYSIRPSERKKGYNKINLYLALKCCQEHGIKEVFMDCDKDNPASAKTMLSFDAKIIREYFDNEMAHCMVQDYTIDVDKAIEKNKGVYEKYIVKTIKRYTEDQINQLVEIIKNNGVVCVPTDTVYGLCARMDSKEAYENLVNTKKRPDNKPFPVMCANINQIKNISFVDEKTEKIIDKFMPGPITIILNKKENIPDYVTNGFTTIAVRMATSKILENIIDAVGCPLFMSSANTSGEPICTTLEDIENACPNIDGILEGKVYFNKASTIVDCTTDEIQVLRKGPITIEQIKNI